MTNNTTVDANGRKVSAFTGKIQNLARVAELTDAVVDIALSEAWRDYKFATGREKWLEAEFDYFLIANNMRHEDVARVLAYNERAKLVAPLMDREAGPEKRRTLKQAAEEWGRLNINLTARARELGWLQANDRDQMGASPVPPRARGKRWPLDAKQWHVNWSDDRSPAEAIVDKLLADEVLARDVYNKLQAKRVSTYRANKRRSQA